MKLSDQTSVQLRLCKKFIPVAAGFELTYSLRAHCAVDLMYRLASIFKSTSLTTRTYDRLFLILVVIEF